MIDVVGIFQRMRQHEARIKLAKHIGQPLHMRVCQSQRIIAGIEELDLGAQRGGRPLRLVLAPGLDLLQRHALLLPGKLGFAALTERQAHDLDAIAALGVQRDRATGAPDEIAGMGRDHKPRLLDVGHIRVSSFILSIKIQTAAPDYRPGSFAEAQPPARTAE